MKSILEDIDDTILYGDIISYANNEMIEDVQIYQSNKYAKSNDIRVDKFTNDKESWKIRLASGAYFIRSCVNEIFLHAPNGFYKYLKENGYIETLEIHVGDTKDELFLFNSKFIKLIDNDGRIQGS